MATNDDKLCTLLDACGTPEAPLCPLQEISLKNGIWYGDEPVCSSEMFQNLGWIKKQRCIAAMKLKADDGFFTVKMLNVLRVVPRDIKGADPDSLDPEKEWLTQRQGPENKAQKPKKTIAKKPVKKTVKPSRHKRLF